MALSDCPECWNTPCTCGHEYKDWRLEDLIPLRDALTEIIDQRTCGKNPGVLKTVSKAVRQQQKQTRDELWDALEHFTAAELAEEGTNMQKKRFIQGQQRLEEHRRKHGTTREG